MDKRQYEDREDIVIEDLIPEEDQEDLGEDKEVEARSYYIDTKDYPNFLFSNFTSRFLAYGMDFFIIQSLKKLVLDPLMGVFPMESIGTLSVYRLLDLGIHLGYFFFLTLIFKGQTPGKMAFGLRVVSLNENKLSFMTILIREVFARYILDRLKFLYLIAIFTAKKQHLGDILCDTSVVKLESLYEYETSLKKIKVEN